MAITSKILKEASATPLTDKMEKYYNLIEWQAMYECKKVIGSLDEQTFLNILSWGCVYKDIKLVRKMILIREATL